MVLTTVKKINRTSINLMHIQYTFKTNICKLNVANMVKTLEQAKKMVIKSNNKSNVWSMHFECDC